ncbi:hypothetical protein [Bosea sp. Root483D1]|uniref:hypothetical protein n=1 Tax=Bosea sp. Root483D1 TaxID=1736544 RepID=UPI0012E3C077|nr:hypothetical protein [Bosea sp. Root483D1]
MIEKIVVTPRAVCGVLLELHGDLSRILAVCATNAKTPPREETGFLMTGIFWLRGPETTESKHAACCFWREPGPILSRLIGVSSAPIM